MYFSNRCGGWLPRPIFTTLTEHENLVCLQAINLAGGCPEGVRTGSRRLMKPVSNRPYKGKIWCVAASSVRMTDLAPALDSTCQQGNGTCNELAPGRRCYEPVSVTSHASYAFNSYWAKYRGDGASCFFNGLAVQTTVDPSKSAWI